MKFSKIVKEVILEQGRYEILVKTYTTPKKVDGGVNPAKMKVQELDTLIKADPTSRVDGDKIKKAGEYSNWIIKQYLQLQPEGLEPGSQRYDRELKEKQELFFEDLYKTTEDLLKFDRFKGRLPQEIRDINKLNIDTLFDAVREFRLEKTKASKEEKKQAATTYEHPGSDIIFRGQDWTVVKITNSGDLGRDAACFYGGNSLRSGSGETNWCTSSPGLPAHFNRYIKEGPLYVIIPNEEKSYVNPNITKGETSSLPALRYQFHFPSNQFKNPDDDQIDLVEFMIKNPELKEVFKTEFMKGILKSDGKKILVEYPRDSASKFIAVYGFEEFFKTLPNDINKLEFIKTEDKNTTNFSLKLPQSIARFKQLNTLHLDGVLEELPKEIGELKNLLFLSLPNNKNLKELPKELVNLPNLVSINVIGSNPNIKIPKELIDLDEDESTERQFHLFR